MLAPGDSVADRYVVEALVGSGGLAHVYRVRHAELGSAHALKVLAWDTPALASRMLREGRIQAQLNHPHIVRVTDVLRDDGMVGLLMDYIEGQTLEQLIAEGGARSVEDCLRLMAPVLSAVAAAHDARVLHRDLKPANVLLEQRGSMLVPKVTDFGIAKALSDSGDPSGTRPNAVLGTPAYMAPEQFLDAAQVTPAVDVFSLAVVTHFVLTGAPVFVEPAEGTPLVARIIREPTPLPDGVPEAVRAALAQAMSTEPDERFPDARTFAQALLAGHPELLALVGPAGASAPLDPVAFTTAPPAAPRRPKTPAPTLLPPLQSTANEPARRSPLPLVGAFALLVAVLITLWWWSRGPEPLPPELRQPVTDVTAPPLPPPPVEPSGPPDEVAPTGELDADTQAAPIADELVADEPVADEPVELRAVDVDAPPAPEPVAEPAPAPADPVDDGVEPPEPEADTEPVAEPPPVDAPRPEAVTSVVSTATTAEPEPMSQRVDLAGRWVGTADGRPLVMELSQGIDGTVTGEVAFTLGTTQRTFRAIGTVDGERVEFDADGAFRFIGALRDGELSGTYTARSRGRSFPWSTRRD